MSTTGTGNVDTLCEMALSELASAQRVLAAAQDRIYGIPVSGVDYEDATDAIQHALRETRSAGRAVESYRRELADAAEDTGPEDMR